jgi:hypothetical protein
MSNPAESYVRNAQSVSGSERRENVRYSADFTVECNYVDAPSEEKFVVSVRDISVGGVRVLAQEAIESDALLFVELPIGGIRLVRGVEARVRHAKKLFGGGWMIGCEFVTRLKEYELRSVLEKRTVAGQSATSADCKTRR